MKTIKEASIDLKFNKAVLQSNPKLILEQSFKAGAEFVQMWIPIEEELPPLDGSQLSILCIVRHPHVGVQLARYNYYFKKWGCPYPTDLTHWRPVEIKM